MQKCAVIIGVNKTGGLPILAAAVKGAKDFKQWADKQGFDTVLLTDENKQVVTVKNIADAVRAFVEKRTYGQMVIFFSGHGILKSATDEQWLLSNSPGDVNETVNVLGSRMLARRTGIPHIVFISDACRSIPNDKLITEVIGSVIFPNVRKTGSTEIDVLYSTSPGDPSFEAKEEIAVGNFRGLYTECMLRALRGEIKEIVLQTTEDDRSISAVPVYELNAYLKNAVPDAASQVDILLSQTPDGEIISRLPKYLSRISIQKESQRISTRFGKRFDQRFDTLGFMTTKDWNLTDPEPYVTSKYSPNDENDGDDFSRLDSLMDNVVNDGTDIGKKISDSIDVLNSAKGRESFETETGFTIIGAAGYTVILPFGKYDDFVENGIHHVRIYQENVPHTMLLQLSNGNATPMAILPGFIGTVVLENERIINVNYSPSRNSRRHRPEDPNFEFGELARRRTMVAASARLGLFKLDGSVESIMQKASYLRQYKAIDPTLGLYAAYAYAQSGNYSGVASIYEYMTKEPEPVLYDVYMLNLLNDENPQNNNKLPAPFCPMLSQGWSYMSVDRGLFPGEFRELAKYLIPGLWTTFTPQGSDIVKQLMANNQFL